METGALIRPDRSMDQMPEIDVGERNLVTLSEQAWHAIQRANEPPRWFAYGEVPIRLVLDDEHARIQVMNLDRMRHLLARVARWVVFIKDKPSGQVIKLDAAPPKDTVRDILAYPLPPLPKLSRIVRAPAFASDGSIRTEPGYHNSSRTYYHPVRGFELPPLPSNLGRDDAIAAVKFLLDELLHDFPFASPADRAHAVLLLLQPFFRELVEGPTPMFLIEKPKPGTGAGLLTEVLTYPSLGASPPVMTEGRDEDDWRKRITAKLVAAPNVVVLDNLRRRLDSAALSAALTALIWEDRILGFSRTEAIPVRCTWIATGNNPGLSSEMSRRVVRIRMDAKSDRPWLRTGFRHELPGWAVEHRTEIVRAALVVIGAWIAAGRPLANDIKPLGSYPDWTRVSGGILRYAGVNAFLDNKEEVYEVSDVEGDGWRRFFQQWWVEIGERNVCVADVFPIATSGDVLDLGSGNEKSQRTRLGLLLRKQRETQYGDFRLEQGGPIKGAQGWRLVSVAQRSSDVPANVHPSEVTSSVDVTAGAAAPGERCERLPDPSAHARYDVDSESPKNVRNVRNVHRPPQSALFDEGAEPGEGLEEFEV